MKRLALVAFDLPGAAEGLARLGPQLEQIFRVQASYSSTPLDVSGCFVQARRQFDAKRVLGRVAEVEGADFVLAVTGADLFMPVFTFVLGEALLGGKAAVVSTFRLHEERYGLPPDPARLAERLLKESVHELGHCHGLTHCHSSKCVMFTSAGVEEVDLKGVELCSRCRGKL